MLKKIALFVAMPLALIALVAACGTETKTVDPEAAKVAAKVTEKAEKKAEKKAESTEAPVEEVAEEPEAAEGDDRSGAGARSAESYIEMSGFSRAALIDQLTSEYGEGFKKKDAVYAVESLHADWKAEAVESDQELPRDGRLLARQPDRAAGIALRRPVHARPGRVRREEGIQELIADVCECPPPGGLLGAAGSLSRSTLGAERSGVVRASDEQDVREA